MSGFVPPRVSRLEVWLLSILLLLSLLLLLLGATLPLMTVERLWIFEQHFSLLGGLLQMWQQGHWPLALVLGGFSLLMPLAKLTVLGRILMWLWRDRSGSSGLERWLHWMHGYGKWSMLDVFVVAVLLTSVKLGALANVQLHSGLYAFAGSILMTMLVTARVVSRLSR